MRIRQALAMFLGLLSLTTGAVETGHPLGPERLAELTALVADRTGLETDTVACRVMAASLAYRFVPRGEGRWSLQKDDFIDRVLGYHRETFKPVSRALDAADLPDAHRELLRRDFARKCLWPVRYRYLPAPVGTWTALIDDIPAGCRLLTVDAGQGLHEVLGAEWPAWTGLPAVARKAVCDRLAAINPRLRSDGGFLAPTSAARPGHVPGTGVDPLDTGFFAPLAELVPETDLTPAERQQWEHLPIPLGTDEVWVCRYRLVPSDLLVPSREVLAAWADPAGLDLANLPLTDLACLADLRPERLDLSGTAVADLGPLADQTSLRELRLLACPVTDLGPLAGLELQSLDLRDTRVRDLSALAGMPLRWLDLRDAPATDLAPLADCPLEMLLATDDGAYTGIKAVVAAAGLKRIGDVPVADWLRENAWKREEGEFWDLASDPPVQDCSGGGESPPSAPPDPQPDPPSEPTAPPADGDTGDGAGNGDVLDELDDMLED